MKMRMKKLISISTIPVLALALLLVLGTVLSDGAAAQAKKPAPSLTGTTEYDFVGHLGIFDAEGRLLGWIGTISGDIEGVIHWWVVLPMKTTGQITHWVSRWEIWSDDPLQENSEAVLLLAGDDAGTNIVRHEKNSIWRANGIVTEAYGEFQDWIGRQVHEDGNLNWDFPYWGSGIFRVN
jgi:hypothetical protein